MNAWTYTHIFLKYLYRKINTALSRQFIILLQRSFLHWKLNVDVLKMQKCIERFWALSGVLNWSASALFSKFVCEIKFSDIIMWVLCNHIDHHFTYIQSHVFGMKFLKWCRHIAHLAELLVYFNLIFGSSVDNLPVAKLKAFVENIKLTKGRHYILMKRVDFMR